ITTLIESPSGTSFPHDPFAATHCGYSEGHGHSGCCSHHSLQFTGTVHPPGFIPNMISSPRLRIAAPVRGQGKVPPPSFRTALIMIISFGVTAPAGSGIQNQTSAMNGGHGKPRSMFVVIDNSNQPGSQDTPGGGVCATAREAVREQTAR